MPGEVDVGTGVDCWLMQLSPPYFLVFILLDDELYAQKAAFPAPFAYGKISLSSDEMKALVQEVCFKYRKDIFKNPGLWWHLRNLEVFDLVGWSLKEDRAWYCLKLKWWIPDSTLLMKFKEQVFPFDYNPEKKATRRILEEKSYAIEVDIFRYVVCFFWLPLRSSLFLKLSDLVAAFLVELNLVFLCWY